MANEGETLKAVWTRTPACLEVSVLLDAVERGDDAVRTHVEACPRCSAEVLLYRDITASPVLPGVNVRALNDRVTGAISGHPVNPSLAGGWWARLFRPAILTPAMAAIAMLLVFVGTKVQQRSTLAPNEGVERAQAVELLSPKGEVSEVPGILRWSPVASATSYRVRILEVDRNILWEANAKTTSAAIPASVQKQALPGKRLIWSVDAFNSKGLVVASGSQDFTRALVPKGRH